jgi:hypothetical protein
LPAESSGYNAMMLSGLAKRPRLFFLPASVFILIFGVMAGCQTNHKTTARVIPPKPATEPALTAKPMIDFRRGAAGFPLVGHLPLNSRDNFVKELTGGYLARVDLPATRPAVVARGRFPDLDSLDIDLSGGKIRDSYRPTSLKSVRRLTPIASVRSLSYTADPLHYDDASQSLRITASDVKLALIRGRGDKEVLVMTDASQGEARFFASLDDLNTIVRDATDDNAGRAVFFVRDTRLTMMSENPRSLAATVQIRGLWLLIPTSITLSGRIDIDQHFDATLSHLSCTGTDVGGPLLAGFINSALKKYDGKVMPLAAFPGDRMKMRDLHISVDDALRIDAEFGD